MSTHNDDLDARLKKAFTPDTQTTSGDTVIDPDTLQARRIALVNPKARRATALAGATGALATIAAVAVITTSVLSPPEPLFTLAGGGAGTGASDMGAAESSDLRIAPSIEYQYVPSDNLSRESGRGEVFQLQLAGTPESVLEQVGGVFGITGEVQETDYFDPRYPSYVIGSQTWDGGPSVTITWLGTGSWWYSNPAAYPEQDCEEPGDSSEEVDRENPILECFAPTPTGSIPSVGQAQARAVEIFTQTGLPVTPDQVRVIYSDEWGISLSASLVVAGEDTAIEWSVGIGPDGIITYATGHSVSVESRGTYDTISAYDAVSRIQEGIWWGSPGHEYYEDMALITQTRADDGVVEPGIVTDDSAQDFSTATDQDGSEAPSPGEEAPAESEPAIDPLPENEIPLPAEYEVEVVDSVVTSAKPALLLVYDANDGAWLVPGFVMTHDQGWWISVISLIDGVLQMPDPVEYGIMPMEE